MRVSIVDDSLAARVVIGKASPAALAPIKRTASRRVIWFSFRIVMSSGVACQAVALREGLETSLIGQKTAVKRFLDFARNDKKG